MISQGPSEHHLCRGLLAVLVGCVSLLKDSLHELVVVSVTRLGDAVLEHSHG